MGPLWAAADLITPMAIRVAATLRVADHITAGDDTGEALTGPTRDLLDTGSVIGGGGRAPPCPRSPTGATWWTGAS